MIFGENITGWNMHPRQLTWIFAEPRDFVLAPIIRDRDLDLDKQADKPSLHNTVHKEQ